MKEITIKRNSWHFWLASSLGSTRSIETDFCRYVRRVLLGLFLLSSYLLAIVLYLWSGYDCIVWAYSVLFHGTHIEMPRLARLFVIVSSLALLIIVAIGVAWCVEKIKEYLENRAYERRRLGPQQSPVIMKEPSFLQTAYRSIKDKVCFKMNIVD